ncbi:hypothetical protein [Sessilibacter corallicola]|uniref:hypothetical protein n=1 Tax=Sessilibacter corallicola TaxID=2904075 RepID=UPI001E36B011|nr:hypothetical protein [Sessilibacter corallicola]MCE2030343.1 hypothetical protein [Sessilibacter corallicola]
MELYEKIVEENGQELLDMILTVYVNFYFSELEIIDLCAKWIPKRTNLTEKFYLVHHASDEVSHSKMFKDGVKHLGMKWDDSLIEKYRLKDIDNRFDKLLTSDDELEVLIGLNVYAEGVLAMEELAEMAETKPEYFPSFARIASEEKAHLAFGKKVLQRMIDEDETVREKAQVHVDWYKEHIKPYLWTEISDVIDDGIKHGVLYPDFRERAVQRFEDEMSSLGLAVNW